LQEAQAWIREVKDFWEQGFDRLDALLRADQSKEEKP